MYCITLSDVLHNIICLLKLLLYFIPGLCTDSCLGEVLKFALDEVKPNSTVITWVNIDGQGISPQVWTTPAEDVIYKPAIFDQSLLSSLLLRNPDNSKAGGIHSSLAEWQFLIDQGFANDEISG